MELFLTKAEALQTLDQLQQTWKNPPFEDPAFLVELEYIHFLSCFLRDLRIDNKENVHPVIKDYLESAVEFALRDVCRVLDQYQYADGIMIWNLISTNQLILRRYRRIYNSQIPTKSSKTSKGLTKNVWEDYNHWQLTLSFWNGFLNAFEEGFSIVLPHEPEYPIELMLAAPYKPLWGMWMAFNGLGRPFISTYNDNDSIHVTPFASWNRYKIQLDQRQQSDSKQLLHMP